jgi:hypothetical protein
MAEPTLGKDNKTWEVCKILNRKEEQELSSQPLPWSKEKPTKPCVVETRTKDAMGQWDYTWFDLRDPVELKSWRKFFSADEYLILEEL